MPDVQAGPEFGPISARRKQRAMLISIGSAGSLTIIKLVIAALTGSVAVLSEAVHSFTDLIAAGLVWYSLRHAAHPPDTRHRYGHEKLENFSAIAEGAIIIAAIGFVIFQAIERLAERAEVTAPLLGVAAMVLTAGVNLTVALHLRKVGQETDSAGVTADSQQLMADVITSLAVAGGLLLVEITGNTAIDPIVALLVAGIVVRIGMQLIIGSTRILLDESLPDTELDTIEHVLAHDFRGVAGYHRLRTRKAGSRRHVDVHITLDRTLALWEAHSIAHDIEKAISEALPNTDVLTHIEPDTETPPPGEDLGPSDRY